MTVDLRMSGVYAMMKVDTSRGGWLMMMICHMGEGEKEVERRVLDVGEGGEGFFEGGEI